MHRHNVKKSTQNDPQPIIYHANDENVSIGPDSTSGSNILKFRSQTIADTAWISAGSNLSTIDASGNITKSSSNFTSSADSGGISFTGDNLFYGSEPASWEGNDNIVIGNLSGAALTTANNCVLIGSNSGNDITTASDSTLIGHNAGAVNTAAQSTAVGSNALLANVGGSRNVALGYNALSSITTNNGSTAVGYQALLNCTGGNNTGLGDGSGDAITSGVSNVSVGAGALSAATTVSSNTAVGASALALCTAGETTAVGFNSLAALTSGTANTALGYRAGETISTQQNNTLVGHCAAPDIATNGNTCIGNDTGLVATTAAGLTLIGAVTGNAISSGGFHTAVGNNALQTVTTGDSCTCIGQGSDVSAAAAIGRVSIGRNVSNSVNTSVFFDSSAASAVGSSVVAGASGQWGPDSSSRAKKQGIRDLADDIDSSVIYDLQPVSFYFRCPDCDCTLDNSADNMRLNYTQEHDEDGEPMYTCRHVQLAGKPLRSIGLIAEDVYQLLPNIVPCDLNDNPVSVRYDLLCVLLLEELKKLRNDIIQLRIDMLPLL